MDKRKRKDRKCKMYQSWCRKAGKHMRTCRVIGACLLVLLCMCITESVRVESCLQVFAAENNRKDEEQKQFEISATAGINNSGKQEKDFIADVTVTNHGKDFSGNMVILLPVSEKNTGVNTAYQKTFSIKAGETKTISVPMWLYLDSPEMRIRITDEENNILQKQTENIILNKSGYLGLIGVLTDKEDDFGYLSMASTDGENFEVEMFSPEAFPNQKERLECVDYLLIDNYDTTKWSKKQYQAVTQWVKDGGILILGTGADGEKTLAGFQEDFLGGTIESVSKDGIARLNFPDGQVTKAMESDLTFTKVKKDSGWIYIVPEDLALDFEEWRTKGLDYTTLLRENLERDKLGDFSGAETIGGNYGLNITDKGKMPGSLCYGVILVIYAVAVSVVLFAILKKKGKLEWTWKLVPLFSILCCILIYVIGAKNRITAPEVIYLRTMQYAEEGKALATTQMDFSVTSPYSDTYSMAVPKEETIYSRGNELGSTNHWWDSLSVVDEDYMESYKMTIREHKDQQIVTFHDFDDFETAFLGTKERQVKTDGTYHSDITCENYDYSGTFTNETGHDIQHAVFLDQGRVYKLGDIKSGETVTISDELKNGFSIWQSDYTGVGYEENRFGSYCDISEIFGGETGILDKNASIEQLRYANVLSNYFINEKATQRIMEPKVIGQISSASMEESLCTEWGMNCSGVTLGVFPVNVKNSDGETFVGDILTECYGNGEVTGWPCFNISQEQNSVVEYRLAKNETLTGLYCLPIANDTKTAMNPKYLSEYLSFQGEIQAYNYDKKKYETIFKNTDKREIRNVKPYIGEDNVLRLKFKVDKEDLPSDELMRRPVISATKITE